MLEHFVIPLQASVYIPLCEKATVYVKALLFKRWRVSLFQMSSAKVSEADMAIVITSAHTAVKLWMVEELHVL